MGEETQTSSPLPTQTREKSSGQLRQAEMFTGPDYYNPNPWVTILGRQMNLKLKLMG